jgi:hypothetical protein
MTNSYIQFGTHCFNEITLPNYSWNVCLDNKNLPVNSNSTLLCYQVGILDLFQEPTEDKKTDYYYLKFLHLNCYDL